MNKKIPFAIFAIFAIMAPSILAAVPVHAYQYYHGYTSSWDYGDDWHSIPLTSDSEHNTGTGEMSVATAPGYAWAYMNSAYVEAQADVDSITVTAFWEAGSKGSFFGVYGFECRLYINTEFQGIKYASYDNWDAGFEQFTFTGLDVDTDDHLDVDVKFTAISSGSGVAFIGAKFLYIAFTTD